MLILLILTSLFIIGLKKLDLIPVIIFCQASAIAIICYRMGLEVPLLVFVFTVKALIIPLLLYYVVKKTIVYDQKPTAFPVAVIVALVAVIFVAAYFFTRQMNAGPFAMAAIFTALIGILLITSRKTLVGQLAGFIVLQNGIFAFTSSFCLKFTFALEMVLAIDVLLSVLIMVYAILAIYKRLGNIDIKTFTTLRG
jgi:hydrogenase-4 component E